MILETIVAYFHGAETVIYGLALTESVDLLSQEPLNCNQLRLQCLASCLQACKSYTDNFLKSDLVHINTPSMLIFSHCLKISYQLLAIQDYDWDVVVARNILDPSACLERAALEAQKANATLQCETGEDSAFKEASEMMLASLPQWTHPSQQDTHMSGSPALPLLDILDDSWLSGLVNF